MENIKNRIKVTTKPILKENEIRAGSRGQKLWGKGV